MSPTLSGTVVLDTDVEVRCDLDPIQPPIVEIVSDGWSVLLEVTDRRVAEQLADAAAQCRDALPEEKT